MNAKRVKHTKKITFYYFFAKEGKTGNLKKERRKIGMEEGTDLMRVMSPPKDRNLRF